MGNLNFHLKLSDMLWILKFHLKIRYNFVHVSTDPLIWYPESSQPHCGIKYDYEKKLTTINSPFYKDCQWNQMIVGFPFLAFSRIYSRKAVEVAVLEPPLEFPWFHHLRCFSTTAATISSTSTDSYQLFNFLSIIELPAFDYQL